MDTEKISVRDFWDQASCGEALYLAGFGKDDYEHQAKVRYDLIPFIPQFAQFEQYHDKKVLEVGVGLGADHERFAAAGAMLSGVDLTPRAINHTRRRLELCRLSSDLQVADAENLPFASDTFDLVYSWGVLHHSPNTAKAIDEVYRVLKPGGTSKIMIYHKYSFVGFMLWIRYALLRLRPFTSLEQIYDQFLESPGTKAYSVAEAQELFKQFQALEITTQLSDGDLLSSAAGQRHEGPLLAVARLLWPRWIIGRFFKKYGLCMLISAVK
jgi:ubiquinone/menaquinone biosynthesis C-methylase UbiE